MSVLVGLVKFSISGQLQAVASPFEHDLRWLLLVTPSD